MNEAAYWRQHYEVLLANLGDMVRAATAKQPVVLADKESYELGKLHGEISEREACAKMFDGAVWAYDYREIAAAIRARGEA